MLITAYYCKYTEEQQLHVVWWSGRLWSHSVHSLLYWIWTQFGRVPNYRSINLLLEVQPASNVSQQIESLPSSFTQLHLSSFLAQSGALSLRVKLDYFALR